MQANQQNLAKLTEQDPTNKELQELKESVEREIQGLLTGSAAGRALSPESQGHNLVPEIPQVAEVPVVLAVETAAPVAAEPERRAAPSRLQGRVVNFDSKKGFGFIRADSDGGEDLTNGVGDIFVHRKSVVMAEGFNQVVPEPRRHLPQAGCNATC